MSPTVAEEPALVRLARGVRAGRRWILATAACCAVLAATASVVRKPTYRGQVYISLGGMKPVGWLEDPQDLLRKLKSPAQFSKLAGIASVARGTSTSTTVEGVTVTWEDFEQLEFHGRQDGAKLIGFYVDSPSEEIALAISRRVTRSILARHEHLYQDLVQKKKEQIEYYESLLDRIEDKAAESEAEGAWQGVVDVAARIAQLDEDQLAPAARPTEIVLGPDVEKISPNIPPPVAGVIGFMAGIFLAVMLIGLIQALPYELINALRGERPSARTKPSEGRAADDRSARDVFG
jgi:hypothetical protein